MKTVAEKIKQGLQEALEYEKGKRFLKILEKNSSTSAKLKEKIGKK